MTQKQLMTGVAFRPPPGVHVELEEGDVLFPPEGAAAFVGQSLSSLYRHRVTGSGPRWLRLGLKRIGYRRSDLIAWQNGQPNN